MTALPPRREPAPAPDGTARHRAGALRRAPAERRRLAVLVTAELVLTVSVLVLLYLGWYLVVDDRVAAHRQTSSATELEREWDASPAPTRAPEMTQPRTGEAFATIRVPRFGADWRRVVVEGTGLEELSRGVGHYTGSALPGQVGNFAVAGHRLTHGSAFTEIDRLRDGDVVGVRTAGTWFVYRVTGHEIVEPGQVDVIAAVPGEPGVAPTRALMTLTSCHPLYGSSQRYVVHAVLDRTQPAADGVPTELRGAGR